MVAAKKVPKVVPTAGGSILTVESTKLVTDLVPGDQVPVVRTVAKVERSATSMLVTFDDGTTTTYDLAAAPAVTVTNG